MKTSFHGCQILATHSHELSHGREREKTRRIDKQEKEGGKKKGEQQKRRTPTLKKKC